MVSYKTKMDPLADYITKLMVLEAVKCSRVADQPGLTWIQETMNHLASRWNKLAPK